MLAYAYSSERSTAFFNFCHLLFDYSTRPRGATMEGTGLVLYLNEDMTPSEGQVYKEEDTDAVSEHHKPNNCKGTIIFTSLAPLFKFFPQSQPSEHSHNERRSTSRGLLCQESTVHQEHSSRCIPSDRPNETGISVPERKGGHSDRG